MEKTIPITGDRADSALDLSSSDMLRIELPKNAHVRCLANFDEKSAEYVLLMNGIVLDEDPHKPMVHIRCNADNARAILRILAKECPEFSDELHVYPDPA